MLGRCSECMEPQAEQRWRGLPPAPHHSLPFSIQLEGYHKSQVCYISHPEGLITILKLWIFRRRFLRMWEIRSHHWHLSQKWMCSYYMTRLCPHDCQSLDCYQSGSVSYLISVNKCKIPSEIEGFHCRGRSGTASVLLNS